MFMLIWPLLLSWAILGYKECRIFLNKMVLLSKNNLLIYAKKKFSWWQLVVSAQSNSLSSLFAEAENKLQCLSMTSKALVLVA
jgi:hypothetical protein